MAAQQHKIMRQVLELHGCPPEAVPQLQSALRDNYGQRLLPLIEAACSALGSPGRVDRIDRLEIDLGQLPLDRLDAAMGEQLEARFSQALAAAIRSAPPGDADLELFSHFIRTGGLPWWADSDDRGLLEANLQDLLARGPQVLRQALLAAQDARPVLRRLALSYPDRLLGRMAGSLAPALSAAGPAGLAPWLPWLPWLQAVALARGHAARNTRLAWWEEVLRAASRSAAAAAAAPALMGQILGRLARRLGLDELTLLAALRQAVHDGAAPQGSAPRELIDGLWRDAGGARLAVSPEGGSDGVPVGGPDGAPVGAPALERLRQGLAQWEAPTGPHTGLWARLSELLDCLPAPLLVRAAAAWGAGPVAGDASQALLDALAALLRAALAQGLVPAALLARHAVGLRQSPSPRLSAATRAAIATRLRDLLAEAEADPPEAAEAAGFSAADDLPVGNGGMVILWPFLATLFKRLGLTDDGRFKDAAAAQRATGLLQYLASGDAEPMEPQLPLNKVLCGLAPDAAFDFGAPLSPAEAEECDELLAAVIQQAPILQGMSLAGLRGSFLLRPGQLSTRDGHWLLRVERLTHDIVLDRLPWGLAIVRLPWMPTLMQVEW